MKRWEAGLIQDENDNNDKHDSNDPKEDSKRKKSNKVVRHILFSKIWVLELPSSKTPTHHLIRTNLKIRIKNPVVQAIKLLKLQYIQ